MGILSARTSIGVSLWVYPLVCANGAYHKTWRYSLRKDSVLFLEILCCVEGGLRNLWKKSHRRVAFEVLEQAMAWKIVSV